MYLYAMPTLERCVMGKEIKVLFYVWFIWRSVYHKFNYPRKRLKPEKSQIKPFSSKERCKMQDFTYKKVLKQRHCIHLE